MRKILNIISWSLTIFLFIILIRALIDDNCSVIYIKIIISYFFVSLIGSISGTPDFD